ncbi:MAG: BMP family ABC transporter substrate-binding protein [Oscillospiraceae bacterium]|mgnify:FL=1|nr:BMP family ABC transporter substrate-binding protein [Oscillospiraceae bacterium]
MKRFLALILALCMVFALCACGGNQEDPKPEESGEPVGAEMKVAMVTDYGDITDQSFNQTTYEACKLYCATNDVAFKYYKPTDDSTAARVEMIEMAVAEGYNVVVLPGYAFAGAIAAVQDKYPEVKFVGLDVSEWDLFDSFYNHDEAGNRTDLIDANNPEHIADNVFCAVYQEELSGYMAGYAAVKLGYEKLGFLGGMAVPAVIRYGYGFVQGVDAAAAELDKQVELKYVYGGQFYGDGDITAVMDTWYNAGTEIVFACGGGIFTSVGEACSKVDAKVIGVDTDQAGVINGLYGDGITLTSATKGLAATVNTLLSEIAAGNWANYGGQIQTLGLVSENPVENYVQLAESTQFAEGFTEEDYAALVAAMLAGDVVVSNSTDAMPAVTNVTIDDQGQIK